jgi:hypothetical protein
VVGSCEDGNEHLVSMNCREFLDQQSDYWLLDRDSGLWSSKFRTSQQTVPAIHVRFDTL